MNEIDADKNVLRRSIASKITALNFEDRILESQKVMAKVEHLPEFQSANTIMCYHSMSNEVSTHEAIARWRKTKTVVLPRVKGDNLMLFEYSPEKLVAGKYGIFEPALDCRPVDLKEIDLIIVPGVGFDTKCNRMGHGKGYYDRLLGEKGDIKLIGVAFDCQIVDYVPHCSHDVSMDKVITASNIYCNKSETE